MSSDHKSDDLSFINFGTADDCSEFADFSQVKIPHTCAEHSRVTCRV